MAGAVPVAQEPSKQQVEKPAVQEPDIIASIQEYREALEIGKQQLARMTHLSPPAIRNFLVNDMYPILSDVLGAVEWYVMDLNARLETVEETVGVEEPSEAVLPTFSIELIDFIGTSVQIFGKTLGWATEKKDTQTLLLLQELIANAPLLMAHIQDITMEEVEVEVEEVAEEEAEADIPEVLEPKQDVAQPSPVAELKTESVEEVTEAPTAEKEDVVRSIQEVPKVEDQPTETKPVEVISVPQPVVDESKQIADEK